jgi:hypothetical protein
MGKMRTWLPGLLLLPVFVSAAVCQTRFSQDFDFNGLRLHAELSVSETKTATKGFVAGGSQSSSYHPAGSIYREVTVRIVDARGKAPKGDWIVRRDLKSLHGGVAPAGGAGTAAFSRYRGPLILSKGEAEFFLTVDARDFKPDSAIETAASMNFELFNLEDGTGVGFLALVVTHSPSGIDVLDARTDNAVVAEVPARWAGARSPSVPAGQ